jgi:hypothetical protein
VTWRPFRSQRGYCCWTWLYFLNENGKLDVVRQNWLGSSDPQQHVQQLWVNGFNMGWSPIPTDQGPYKIMYINNKQQSPSTSFPEDGGTEQLWNIELLFHTDAVGHPRRFYCILSPQKLQVIFPNAANTEQKYESLNEDCTITIIQRLSHKYEQKYECLSSKHITGKLVTLYSQK